MVHTGHWDSRTFGDLYKNGILGSFEYLTAKYSLDKKHFFKFLQLKHYIRTEQGGRLLPVTKHPLDDILSNQKELKGFISHMYTGVNSLLEKEGLKVREKWEAYFFQNFEDGDWTELLYVKRPNTFPLKGQCVMI